MSRSAKLKQKRSVSVLDGQELGPAEQLERANLVLNIEQEIGQIDILRSTLMSGSAMLSRRINQLVMCLSFAQLARDRVLALDLTDQTHIRQCALGFDFEWIRGDRFAASVEILPYRLQPQNLRVNYNNLMEMRSARGRLIAQPVPGFFLSQDLESQMTQDKEHMKAQYTKMIGNAEVLFLPKQAPQKGKSKAKENVQPAQRSNYTPADVEE